MSTTTAKTGAMAHKMNYNPSPPRFAAARPARCR